MEVSDPIEALADAWASIDGKLDEFRAINQTARDGHREGYLEDAKELAQRLERRGWKIVKV